MAVSNSIGSNTFDILVCLGIPWMIKALVRASSSGHHSEWFVQVNSEGLAYTVISLLASLCVLYCILLASRFVLSRTVAFVCLVIYAVFLTISLLFELNVFFIVNKPMCESDYWILRKLLFIRIGAWFKKRLLSFILLVLQLSSCIYLYF